MIFIKGLCTKRQNIAIIAKYKENNLAAVIKTNHGHGTAILSGVHFEVDPFNLENSLKQITPKL